MRDKSKLRSRIIVARVTEKEFHDFLKRAGTLDLSLSDFLRKAAIAFDGKDKE